MFKFLLILIGVYFFVKLLFKPFFININSSQIKGRRNSSKDNRFDQNKEGEVTIEKSDNYNKQPKDDGFSDYEEIK